MSRPARPEAERFWEKVDKTPGGCWNWIARCIPSGYGYFRAFDGRNRRAHRLAYELMVGPIPNGLHLDHLCRNRACVNPQHLEPVTPGENVRRGMAGEVQRALKTALTHCKRGHEFTSENTAYRNTTGQRICRICRRDAVRRHAAKKAAEARAARERAL